MVVSQRTEPNEARQMLRQALIKLLAQPVERERLIRMGISASTINRWMNGESEPRLANLRLIVDGCQAEYQAILQPLIEKIWPPTEQETSASSPSPTLSSSIPSAFYSRVHQTLAETPDSLRYWSICHLVLYQALQHLDPDRLGMTITTVHCLPPGPEQKVRYLRESVGLGTASREAGLEAKHFFLGAESLAGQAVSSFQMVVDYGDSQEASSRQGRCVAAAPILRAGRIAGCLVVKSPLSESLTQTHWTVMKDYATLIAVAFDPEQFFDRSLISLVLMPKQERQEHTIASLQERKMAAMRSGGLDSIQAEHVAYQEIARELAASVLKTD